MVRMYVVITVVEGCWVQDALEHWTVEQRRQID